MDISRRFFIKSTGIAVAGLSALPPFLARAASTSNGRRKNKVLIAIFQRGAADGLNMVVPFGDSAYYQMRPNIAIPAPKSGTREAAVDLDGFFGLHPSLSPFKRIFDEGHLAIVHAAG